MEKPNHIRRIFKEEEVIQVVKRSAAKPKGTVVNDDELKALVSKALWKDPEITRSGIVKAIRAGGHSASQNRIQSAYEAAKQSIKPKGKAKQQPLAAAATA